jgi:hypothetical protein
MSELNMTLAPEGDVAPVLASMREYSDPDKWRSGNGFEQN